MVDAHADDVGTRERAASSDDVAATPSINASGTNSSAFAEASSTGVVQTLQIWYQSVGAWLAGKASTATPIATPPPSAHSKQPSTTSVQGDDVVPSLLGNGNPPNAGDGSTGETQANAKEDREEDQSARLLGLRTTEGGAMGRHEGTAHPHIDTTKDAVAETHFGAAHDTARDAPGSGHGTAGENTHAVLTVGDVITTTQEDTTSSSGRGTATASGTGPRQSGAALDKHDTHPHRTTEATVTAPLPGEGGDTVHASPGTHVAEGVAHDATATPTVVEPKRVMGPVVDAAPPVLSATATTTEHGGTHDIARTGIGMATPGTPTTADATGDVPGAHPVGSEAGADGTEPDRTDGADGTSGAERTGVTMAGPGTGNGMPMLVF